MQNRSSFGASPVGNMVVASGSAKNSQQKNRSHSSSNHQALRNNNQLMISANLNEYQTQKRGGALINQTPKQMHEQYHH